MTDTEKFTLTQDYLKKGDVQAIVEIAVHQAVDERLSNGWGKYAEYVTSAIKELKEGQDAVLAHCSKLEVSIEVLKAEMKLKSGVWGLLGGALPILIGLALWFLRGRITP